MADEEYIEEETTQGIEDNEASVVPNNPLKLVGGIATLPCPSTYQWKMQDVSAPNSGRTEDGTMDKARIGQVQAIDVSWQNITTAKVSTVLQAFQDEYISIQYLSPLAGGYVTKTFYVGDRSAPLYNSKMGVWDNVSFSIIEKTCVNPT